MAETLKIVKREWPDKVTSFRTTHEEHGAIVAYAKAHGASLTDVIMSALRQTGVLPAVEE